MIATRNREEARKNEEELKDKVQRLEQLAKDKPRRKALTLAARWYLWNITFGETYGEGVCYCCNQKVLQQTFEAGHVISVAHGGSDNVSNLRVICRKCNLSMSVQNMDEFKLNHFSVV